MSHVHAFFMHMYHFFFILLILNVLVLFYLSLSLFLFLSVSCSVAPKQKSTPSWNPLRFGASSSSPSANSTPSHIRFRDDKAFKDFLKNFSRRSIHLERQVVLSNFPDTDLPTIIYNRGWESMCGIPITCAFVVIQEFYSNMHGFDYSVPHFITHVRGKCIVVTSDLISEVLHVSRVEFSDYLGCEHLRTVSIDELSSRFCETSSSWGDRQNTPCLGFAKGPRFLNMVMTFVLHLLSYCNSIIEPHTRFLLSLLEGLSIDFPFHFILSLINVYRDMATRNKLTFPSAITWILCYFSISYFESTHFSPMCVIDTAAVRRSEAQLQPKRPLTKMVTPPAFSTPSTSAPSSSAGGVTLEVVMAQLQHMDARLDALSDELCQVNTCVGHIA